MNIFNGTCLQGYIDTTYQTLVELFGEPTYQSFDPDEKVTCEWMLTTPEGMPVTIYDWKEYDSGQRCRSGQVYDWHIGGKNREAAAYVKNMVEKAF